MKELIAQMAADVSSMSLAEKMLGGLVVTLFSMVIVFIVLVIIMYAIKIMTSSLSEKPKKIKIEEVKVAQVDKVMLWKSSLDQRRDVTKARFSLTPQIRQKPSSTNCL